MSSWGYEILGENKGGVSIFYTHWIARSNSELRVKERRNIKKIILTFIFIFALCVTCLAQNQTYSDTFTITTYYPAPHGVYGTMRLYPGREPTEGVEPGAMYYDQAQNVIKFYNNTTWVNMSGGGGGGLWIQIGQDIRNTNPGNINITGDICTPQGCLGKIISTQPIAGGTNHDRGACTNTTSVDGVNKGVLVDVGLTNPICRFAGNNCPAGWSQYRNYSTSIATTCSNCVCDCQTTPGVCYGGYYIDGSCTTGSHSFSDKPRETCTYTTSHGQCNQRCNGPYVDTCTAFYSQVGCY